MKAEAERIAEIITTAGGYRPGSGRPEIEDARRNRSVKFSDAEWAEVKRRAKEKGVNMSEYIRSKALD